MLHWYLFGVSALSNTYDYIYLQTYMHIQPKQDMMMGIFSQHRPCKGKFVSILEEKLQKWSLYNFDPLCNVSHVVLRDNVDFIAINHRKPCMWLKKRCFKTMLHGYTTTLRAANVESAIICSKHGPREVMPKWVPKISGMAWSMVFSCRYTNVWEGLRLKLVKGNFPLPPYLHSI